MTNRRQPDPDHFDHTILSIESEDLLSGRYRLVNEIGRGGMGVVWLARDTVLDQDVAVKVLPAVLGRDRRSVDRLKEEAKKSLQVTHPHIVRLINFEQDAARGDLAYLVMQYVDGRTLDDLLADHPQGLPLEHVKQWASQIAGALDYAHEKGLLHRDIKPSNIMIDGDDNAYLMDFGIAREIRNAATRLTAMDSSGTLPYMSPQQLAGRNTRSNDVYSLAATIYEALSGSPPFTGDNLDYQILHVAAQPIQGLPQPVNDALVRGLAKEEKDRWRTAAELDAALNGRSGTVTNESATAPVRPCETDGRGITKWDLVPAAIIPPLAFVCLFLWPAWVILLMALGGGIGCLLVAWGERCRWNATSGIASLVIAFIAAVRLLSGGDAPSPTILLIRSDPPEAEVMKDDAYLDQLTPLEIEVVPGECTLTVDKPGYRAAVENVTAVDGETTVIDLRLQPVRTEGVITGVDERYITVDLGSLDEIEIGTRLTAELRSLPIRDPRTGEVLGYTSLEMTVIDVYRGSSRVIVREATQLSAAVGDPVKVIRN